MIVTEEAFFRMLRASWDFSRFGDLKTRNL